MTAHEPDIETAERVLAGRERYDDVDRPTQQLVRDRWQRGIDSRLSDLDLASELRDQGRTWTECDAEGRLIVRR